MGKMQRGHELWKSLELNADVPFAGARRWPASMARMEDRKACMMENFYQGWYFHTAWSHWEVHGVLVAVCSGSMRLFVHRGPMLVIPMLGVLRHAFSRTPRLAEIYSVLDIIFTF